MICEDCQLEMTDKNINSCTVRLIEIDKKTYHRNATYFDANKRCHDCGIENEIGNYHHAGCDMERCPKCGGQLISCGCLNKGEI